MNSFRIAPKGSALKPAKGTSPLRTPIYFFCFCVHAEAKKEKKGVQRDLVPLAGCRGGAPTGRQFGLLAVFVDDFDFSVFQIVLWL